MKKVGVFFAVAASLYFCLPSTATLSYLTSEKSYSKPISLGTNEDIFEVSTEPITLETKVNKKVSVKKEKKDDGTTNESKEVKTSVSLGSQVIFFYPQRPDIFLTPKNFKVEGLGSGTIVIEPATMPEGNEDNKGRLAFRIAHTMDSVEWESTLKKGELRIQALGGFYDLKIPIRLKTIFNEETVVEEVVVPPDNPPPGGGDTPTEPPTGDGGTETPTEPPTTDDGETPTEPPTEPPTDDGGDTPTEPPTTDDGGTTTEPPTADAGSTITEPPTGDSTVPVPSGANMVAAEK
ncbi:hypothetical protein [Brevibacillus sp. SYSU BS000544]|uniref:hypothetical protein n=1 Tax=Brevibacillus sp. SYSU BS000544 TaxID=3416443 RepID=UPI003CE59D47